MSDIFGSPQSFARLGEVLSVLAALLWAVSIVLFRVAGEKVHALGMNLFKNVLAVGLLLPTMAVFGEFATPTPGLTLGSSLWLVGSGLIGIALSDTLFFMALNKLGAELTAIVDCAYSPFVIGLSFVFLGERMDALQTAGAALIVLAVVMIARKKSDLAIPRRTLLAGIGLGVVALFFQAVGIVMFKPLLGGASILWVTFLRMAGGAAGVAIAIAVHPRRRAIVRPIFSKKTILILLPASLLAAYFSNVIWIGGMKYTLASIASALNQLNTIFIFGLAAIFLKEKITALKLAAVTLAFAGAMLVSIRF
jgi:drug/metabolite transporter (DMT)-like permease